MKGESTMNKNVVIFILVIFTLLGSIWGSVANRKKVVLEDQLSNMNAEIEKLKHQTNKEREQVLGKTAGLQESLVEKDDQLQKARKELVTLRKSAQAVEAQLSECTASLQEVNLKNEKHIKEIQAANNTIASLQADLAKKGGQTVGVSKPESPENEADGQKEQAAEVGPSDENAADLKERLQSVSLNADQLQEDLNACNAQILGLEKLIDEKNEAMDETTQEMDRLKINMDVLLSKIADQRDSMQELQEDNRELAKELAERNEEIANLQEEVMKSPVPQE